MRRRSNPWRSALRVKAAAFILFAGAGTARAMSPATQAAILSGPEALYDLDYPEARARIHKLIDAEPDNPFGYLFEAGAIWWESSNEYGLFKDTPTLEDLFVADIKQAIRTAEAYQKSPDPKTRAEGYFVDGMALGTRGQWNLLRGKWVKAYFDGKKAIKHLNKALKLDPDFYDAYLGLGIYDYQTARLPGVLKLSALFMVHGDAERGIQRIRMAIDHGRYISNQAAQFLVSIYIQDEKNYPEALKLIRQLRERFPQSVYFTFLEMTTLARMGDFENSYRQARGLFDRLPADPALLTSKQLSLLCGMEGNRCLNPDSLTSAVQWLTRALDAAQSPEGSGWTTLLHFYRGVARDLRREHGEAISDYEKVLAAAPFAGLQDRTKSCLLNHCDREEILRTMKSLSLDAAAPTPPEPQHSAAATRNIAHDPENADPE